MEKVTDDLDELIDVEEHNMDDAEILIATFGATARPAQTAMEDARQEGIKVGMMRMLITWPFPAPYFENLSKKIHTVLVPEMNMGQMIHPIKEAIAGKCKVVGSNKIGGEMHLPEELLKAIKEVA